MVRYITQFALPEYDYGFTYLKNNDTDTGRKFIRTDKDDERCGTYSSFKNLRDNFPNELTTFRLKFKYD